ncbi:MAG: tyrosinase family protein [Conexibacter sp.]
MSIETAVLVRRNAWTLPDGDETLAAYAAAVRAMRERDADDPTSWVYQAAMHGTSAEPPEPLWNGCQHGTWFFLPWHRMYVWFFERIVRAAVRETGGPADWALPYWDYGAGGVQATLPLAFRDSPGGDNPLFAAERDPRVNSGRGAIPLLAGSAAPALERPLFVGRTQFGGAVTGVGQFWRSPGAVEQTPHNIVHGLVGGDDGLMSNPLTAAADPIFWLHHANVDRIWFDWAGDPEHADPTDSRWTDQTFSFFDEDGQQVQLTGAEIGDVAGQLGYTYEPAPTSGAPTSRPEAVTMSTPNPPDPEQAEMVGASEQPTELAGAPASVTVPIDRATVESLAGGGDAPEALSERHVYLNIEDIEGERNPGTAYGVYVNLPEGASAAQARRHHVGNLSFFGIEHVREPRGDAHAHGLRYTIDISDLVRELVAQGRWNQDALHVTFRPIEPVDPEASEEEQHAVPESLSEHSPVQVGRVSVFYG